MLTRVLVVQPLFSVVLDEGGQLAETAKPVCTAAAESVGENVAANGAILNALAALLQQLAPLLLQLLPLFIKPANTPPAPSAT